MSFPNVVDLSAVTSGLDSAGTTQLHPLGKLGEADLRTFVYALAGGTLNCDLGAKNALTQHVAYANIAANALVGATSIVLDVAVTDGAAGNGVIAADELVGGYIVIFPHDDNSINRMITSNTAAATSEMTIGLSHPLPVALTLDADHGECMASPYLNVQALTNTTSSVMGMPTVAATVGQYLWLQIGGPVWIAPQGEVSVGNNNRQVVFRHDGSIDEVDCDDVNVDKAQHAGYILANASGGGQGAAFIMLQIDP